MVLQWRRRGNAGTNTEEDEQDSADSPVPNRQSDTDELSSGLDRAELLTRHWDSIELPASGASAGVGAILQITA